MAKLVKTLAFKLLHLPGELAGVGGAAVSARLAFKLLHLPGELAAVGGVAVSARLAFKLRHLAGELAAVGGIANAAHPPVKPFMLLSQPRTGGGDVQQCFLRWQFSFGRAAENLFAHAQVGQGKIVSLMPRQADFTFGQFLPATNLSPPSAAGRVHLARRLLVVGSPALLRLHL